MEGRWRRYYPDFLLKLKNNGWAVVVEVKEADQTAYPNVIAKEQAARELFEKLNSIHCIIKGMMRYAGVCSKTLLQEAAITDNSPTCR